MQRTDFSYWTALCRDLRVHADPAPWHARLIAAYSEATRHYHTLLHLEECLTELDRNRALAYQADVVEMAFWFHDAVYDSHSATNEEDSALLAVDCLRSGGVGGESVETVRRLVLCTKTHEPGADPDAALLIDIDLAILGQPAARFWEYERAIRAEYAWVPTATFAEKRAEILTRFLQRPTIYRTKPFRQKYEAAARANLQAAISRLQNPASRPRLRPDS